MIFFKFFFSWKTEIAALSHGAADADGKYHAVSCFFSWRHDTYTEYRGDNLSMCSKSPQGTEVGNEDGIT